MRKEVYSSEMNFEIIRREKKYAYMDFLSFVAPGYENEANVIVEQFMENLKQEADDWSNLEMVGGFLCNS